MTSPTRSSLYSSLPLRPQQFRALRVVRDRTNVSSASFPKLSMTVIDLRSPEKYEALSYVWGDPTAVIQVSVQSERGNTTGTLSITASLDAALQVLSTSEEELLIFVDQLCINQDDNLEKVQQVKIMGEIYTKARRVIAWLGPSTAVSDRHLKFA
jgi:hypothetical protein